jgi:hypothetical protein
MSATYNGLTSSTIYWAQSDSSIDHDEVGMATISVKGFVAAEDTPTSLESALSLIPQTIPISNTGPIGTSSSYSAAKLASKKARYSEEAVIELSAVYKTTISSVTSGTEEGEDDEAEEDKATTSIAVEEVPILTHPVVMKFNNSQVKLLRSLLNGDIRVNPLFSASGTGKELYEFITDNEAGDDIVEVVFDDTDFTDTDSGVTASAKDYARAIASGVNVWRRPVIRHTITRIRNFGIDVIDIGKVGEAQDIPPKLAVNPNMGGQWFLNGITSSTDNSETYTNTQEWEYSQAGGALKIFYKGGSGELTL